MSLRYEADTIHASVNEVAKISHQLRSAHANGRETRIVPNTYRALGATADALSRMEGQILELYAKIERAEDKRRDERKTRLS